MNDMFSTVGMPRPIFNVLPKYLKQFRDAGKPIAKKVPIPWQSKPTPDLGHFLSVVKENEEKIYDGDICPYCGIKIQQEEHSVRWKTSKIFLQKQSMAFVYSDIHPFHLECMKEGRTFCPFMRTLKDGDFETDVFNILKQKAQREKNKIKGGK